MKVLYISSDCLPDRRVERVAQTAKGEGHHICFVGPFKEGVHIPTFPFDTFYRIPFNKFANVKVPSYWSALKRKLSRIIEEYNPDLIHAHNVIAARLAGEFSIPFIYDDHEYWSKKSKARRETWKPSSIFKNWLWTRWEKWVVERASAVIVTCETVAEEHKILNDEVYVVPNLPLRRITASLKPNFKENKYLTSVYVGEDCSSPSLIPDRNVEGLTDLFYKNNVGKLVVIGDSQLPSSRNVESLGFLPHRIMMEKLTKYNIGLLPWKKHWLHKYINPNKPYEYAHAGLFILTTSDFPCVIHRLGECAVAFDNLSELNELLISYANDLDEVQELRMKTRKFALDNLTWEKNCEPHIIHMYSKI